MICGVPVSAIAVLQSDCWLGVGLSDVLAVPMPPAPARFGLVGPLVDPVNPAELFGDPLANPEFGFAGPAGVPPEPVDCTVSRFWVPNTELGFAGELGLGGTDGFPTAPADGCTGVRCS